MTDGPVDFGLSTLCVCVRALAELEGLQQTTDFPFHLQPVPFAALQSCCERLLSSVNISHGCGGAEAKTKHRQLCAGRFAVAQLLKQTLFRWRIRDHLLIQKSFVFEL